jgi:hypothetical protein
VANDQLCEFEMRLLSLAVFTFTAPVSLDASAEPGNWASTPEGKSRWDACYKETRLNYKTYSLSLADYRQAIEAARQSHIRVCMTRATPPAPVQLAVPTDRHPETALVSWARNP